jgi:hypothetical protein
MGKERALGHARAQHGFFDAQGLEAFFGHELVRHRGQSGPGFKGSLLDGFFHGVGAATK